MTDQTCPDCRPAATCWKCLAEGSPCPRTRQVARARADIEAEFRDVHHLLGDVHKIINKDRPPKQGRAVFLQVGGGWHADIELDDGSRTRKSVRWPGPLPPSGKAACLNGLAGGWVLSGEDWKTCFAIQEQLGVPVRVT